MNELKKIESEHPQLITPDSPTQRVGGAISSFETISHRIPMMSLENAYSLSDIIDWLERLKKTDSNRIFPIITELKVDGVSASLHFKDGSFQTAATRGDGKTGDLITSNVKTIKGLPISIESCIDMDIRGEIFIPSKRLISINQDRLKTGEEPFKNCRNLASGTLKSLDPRVAAIRGLEIVLYGIAQALELGFKRHSEVISFLAKQGFRINKPFKICQNLADIESFINQVESIKESLGFDIDGVVLKVDSLAIQAELGSTSKAPRWAIAFKYAQKQAITKVISVMWQVGRGQITPVAVLDPVELGGTTVSRASLHNIDQIKEKDIRLGDSVVVEKAGYIIPYVVKALPELRIGGETAIEPPRECPACRQPLHIDSNGERTLFSQASDGETTIIRCTNPECLGVLGRRLTYFISQLGIENIGPQLVERLMKAGFLSEVTDLFRLQLIDLLQVERMGDKLAGKIIANISAGRKAPLDRLVAGLGIANVGIVAASELANHFGDFETLRKATLEQLTAIHGIGQKVSAAILDFFGASENKQWLDELGKLWVGPEQDNLKGQSAREIKTFQGKLFVITGEATVSRRELEELVKRFGGKVSSTVSSKTNYLVIGSKEPQGFISTKKSRAIQLNISIINEFELIELSKRTWKSIAAGI